MGSVLTPSSKGSARDYVYQTLRHDILHLDLKPGTKISEKEISEKFQVSRTPVREVFVKLAQEELLDIYPQRGTFVSLINLEHLEEARFVRENLEKAVILEACKQFSKEAVHYLKTNLATQEICMESGNYVHMLQLDEGFHQMIYESCGKKRTWAVIQQLNIHFYRLRILRLAHDFEWDRILAQHWGIFNSLMQQDCDKAVQVTEEHLRLAIVEKEQLVAKYPDYFSAQN